MQKKYLLVENELYKTLPIYYLTGQECQELNIDIIRPKGPYIKVRDLLVSNSKWCKRFRKVFSKVTTLVSTEYRADEPSFIEVDLFTPDLFTPILNHPEGLMVTVYQARHILNAMFQVAGKKLSSLLVDTGEKLRERRIVD